MQKIKYKKKLKKASAHLAEAKQEWSLEVFELKQEICRLTESNSQLTGVLKLVCLEIQGEGWTMKISAGLGGRSFLFCRSAAPRHTRGILWQPHEDYCGVVTEGLRTRRRNCCTQSQDRGRGGSEGMLSKFGHSRENGYGATKAIVDVKQPCWVSPSMTARQFGKKTRWTRDLNEWRMLTKILLRVKFHSLRS